MEIRDLESILAYSATDKKEKIEVNITYGNGTKQRCEIKSFNAYSDCIILNVETDFGKEG